MNFSSIKQFQVDDDDDDDEKNKRKFLIIIGLGIFWRGFLKCQSNFFLSPIIIIIIKITEILFF